MRGGATALAAFTLATLAAATPARAQVQPPSGFDPAEQVVGLFAQTCLRYPGDPAALRAALTAQHMPPLPEQAARFFLGTRSGMAYDASLPQLRLALVSANDGSCSAYAETASAPAVLRDLQDALSGLSPRPVSAPPPRDPALRATALAITEGSAPFTVYAVTTDAPGRVQAALTLRRR